MSYVFRGRLCGLLCDECREPLDGVKLRLYSTRAGQDVSALAAAPPKETLGLVSDNDVKAKAKYLIAEVETANDGSFSVELDDKDYKGAAFEVDIYCATVPHQRPTKKPPAPRQISLTVLQPRWKQTESGPVAVWDYCIPSRFWCAIRAFFDAWTICGKVVDCKLRAPVAGVKVRAFDVDWLQDEDLGSATTDGTGHFRIDYLGEDFRTTPFSPLLNIELFGEGPDVTSRSRPVAAPCCWTSRHRPDAPRAATTSATVSVSSSAWNSP
jgi:hypothetical protein